MRSISIRLKLFKYLIIIVYIVISLLLNIDYLIWIQVALYIHIMIDLLQHYKSNILIIGFLISFFVFLMAGPVAQEYFGAIEKRSYTNDAIKHSHWCIIVSLLSIEVSLRWIKQTTPKISLEDNPVFLESIKLSSRQIFWISYCFMFAYSVKVALFVISNGYISYYTSYSAGIWILVEKIGDIAPLALATFLATVPKKEEAKPLLIAYVIYGLSTILTGKRYEAVFICMFALVVYTYRGWLQKKHILAIALAAPGIIIGLQLVDLFRAGADKASTMSTSGNLVVDFMNYVGNSNKVIRLQYMYRNEIPEYKFYSFGSILDYLKYNFVSKFLFGFQSDRWSRALEGHSLSTIVSYLYGAKFFNSGQGMGSCYIAELYNDFGYVGVVIGNFFTVYVVRRLFCINSKNFLKRVISLFILSPLFLMPRGNFDEMFLYIVSVKNILIFTVIISYAKFIRERSNQYIRKLGGTT